MILPRSFRKLPTSEIFSHSLCLKKKVILRLSKKPFRILLQNIKVRQPLSAIFYKNLTIYRY